MAATSSPRSVSTRLKPDDAIQKHYVELVESVSTSLLDVTMKVYACELIAKELRDNVVNGTLGGKHAAMQIVNAIQSQISFDDKKLTLFCDALKELNMMKNVIQKIITACYGDSEPSGSSTAGLMTTNVSVPAIPGSVTILDGLPGDILDPQQLATVLDYVQKCGKVAKWMALGVKLNLSYADLQVIQKDNADEFDRLMAMLHMWLRSGRATKQLLVSAVSSIK